VAGGGERLLVAEVVAARPAVRYAFNVVTSLLAGGLVLAAM
jgi:hypothetical protein